MSKAKITTANGPVVLEPMFCEVTGEQIGWLYLLSGYDPVYISLEVVDANGKQLIDTSEIRTF